MALLSGTKEKEEILAGSAKPSCWPNFLVLKMSMSSASPGSTLEGRSLWASQASPGRLAKATHPGPLGQRVGRGGPVRG